MCFSLFCRLMRRENGLYLSPMMRHLQKSNTVLLSTHNKRRREQRVGLKRLPDERHEFSNVPTLPYDQLWIYSFFFSPPFFFCSSFARYVSVSSRRGISDNGCPVMGRGAVRQSTVRLWWMLLLTFTPLRLCSVFPGSGERVRVLPAAPMDRPDIRLQAAGPRSHQSSQCLLLSHVRRGRQPQRHRGPDAQRSMFKPCSSTCTRMLFNLMYILHRQLQPLSKIKSSTST